VRGPAAQDPPETLNYIELWTITRQPLHPQMGMSRSHLLHQCAAMPGRILDRDNDLGIGTRRISARHSPQVRCKHHLQALLFALARLGFAACGLLQQVRRQLPRHHIERRTTIDEVLVIPRADGGAMALHPQRGP
jgi:hypothetical protein